MHTTFSFALRDCLKRNKLSLNKVATAINKSAPMITYYASGQQFPNPAVFAEILKLLPARDAQMLIPIYLHQLTEPIGSELPQLVFCKNQSAGTATPTGVGVSDRN